MTSPTPLTIGFDNTQAAESWSKELATITGFRLHVRPARADDRDALKAFFAALGPEDIYFRFLLPLRRIDDWRLNAMTRIDDPRTIDFLAFASDRPQKVIASAMLAADADFDTAEVALVVSPEMKNRGISWTLLDHVSDYAAARGVRKLRAVHCGADSRATALEREAGFTVRRDPEDLTVFIAEKQLAPQPTPQPAGTA
jgi:acetyltransferase